MGGNWESFEVHARKPQYCQKGILKVILVRPQKEKRIAVEKASIFLENT